MTDAEAAGSAAFWRSRWEAGAISFHRAEAHRYLVRFADRLAPAGRPRVLVPLCGKSIDMAFLAARGDEVVGVEVVDEAAVAYFAEHGVPATRDGLRLRGGRVEIHVADFFATTSDSIGPVTCAYDRAALVAIPPARRADYAAHLVGLLPVGAAVLLVTLEYDPAAMTGPPFSVADGEVAALFGERCTVETLDAVDVLGSEPRMRGRGLGWLVERATLVTVR